MVFGHFGAYITTLVNMLYVTTYSNQMLGLFTRVYILYQEPRVYMIGPIALARFAWDSFISFRIFSGVTIVKFLNLVGKKILKF